MMTRSGDPLRPLSFSDDPSPATGDRAARGLRPSARHPGPCRTGAAPLGARSGAAARAVPHGGPRRIGAAARAAARPHNTDQHPVPRPSPALGPIAEWFARAGAAACSRRRRCRWAMLIFHE
ncbi:hypothetical protein C2845_PM13G19590 [Panicum miliaceum]|uniref:Uncharacterized protein n=1 Tax=Panicum miliaceum TaxID=4540 RepID=A0A3L6RK10_PANMI|nr:hypothetical protein C2845_PM13G19590 [Panicum miliaceum]